MSNFIFSISSSKYAICFYGLFYVIWLLMLFLLGVPVLCSFVFAIAALLFFALKTSKNLSSEQLIISEPFLFFSKEPETRYICSSAYLSSWVLVLQLKNIFSSKKKSVLIFKDALNAKDYQSLRILLKYRFMQRKDRFKQVIEIR